MEKPKEFAQANPERCPSYYTASEFIEDFKEAHNLWTLRNFVMQLYQKLNDTLTLAGNQSYQKALKFYDTAKMTARQNVPGTRAVHEELTVRFPGRSRKAPPDENIQES